MKELSPRIASELAKDIYLVQNEQLLPALLSRPEFSLASSKKTHLKAEVGGRLLRTAKDGFGVCAIGGGDHKKSLFLIFRGSTSANNNADWVSNGRIGVQFSSNGLPVHIGFNSIFKSMLPEIKHFLDDNSDFNTVHCIGHSLGGAIATLAADWIKTYKKKAVRLYTFGAPKPGLMLFSSNLTRKLGKQNIHRVYHATDPVPMIPLFPFVQPPLPGYGHYIPSNENVLSAEAHDMSKYVQSVKNSVWPDLERRTPPYNVEHMIEVWLKSKMPVSGSSPKIWQWINSALIYVIKKVAGPALVTIQAGFMGVLTLADMIAWLLKSGINLIKSAAIWVKRLMVKMMQALGIKTIKEDEEPSQVLMRNVLTKVMDKTNEEARRAVMRIK